MHTLIIPACTLIYHVCMVHISLLVFLTQSQNPLYEKASDEIENPMYAQYMEGQSNMFTATSADESTQL